jgi:hypothetical protein
MLKGAKGDSKMNTRIMRVLGCFVLGGVLLLLGPSSATASIVQYKMEIAPITIDGSGTATVGSYLAVSSGYTNMATGWYALKVSVQVSDNYIWTSDSTPSMVNLRTKRIGGGLTYWAFNFTDSTFNYNAANPLGSSKIAFADDGGWGSVLDNAVPDLTHASDSGSLLGIPGITGTGGLSNRVQIQGTTVSTADQIANPLAPLSGYGTLPGSGGNTTVDAGPALSYAVGLIGPIANLPKMIAVGGGVLGASPNTAPGYTTVLTTAFDFTGNGPGNSAVTINLVPDPAGTKVISGAYTPGVSNGGTYGLAVGPATTLTGASFSIQAPGSGPKDYTTEAQAVITAIAHRVATDGDPLGWQHPVKKWWDPTANITLDGSAATADGSPITEWKWTITDATYAGINTPASLVVTSNTSSTTITVAQLIAAGFQTPPILEQNNLKYTYGTLGVSIFDGVEGAAGTGTGYAGTTPFLLPEPASMFVLALGAVGALIRRRRK